MLDEIVWKIGGEQGQGLDSTSDIFATVCNRSGYYVYAYKTFQSRIKGGHTDFTSRVSQWRVLSPAAGLHVLAAMDQECIDLVSPELRPDGLLLADAHFKPSVPSGVDLIAFDMSTMAREMGNPIYRNVIAIGASAALLGLDLQPFKDYVADKFGRKGPKVVEGNWQALDAGYEQATKMAGSRGFKMGAAQGRTDRLLLTGNDAIALGALAAGCRAVFAYPITPASEILEVAARYFPRFGGVAVQMEDELASIAACVGAGFAGVRVMTASAGPGISLMQENLGLAGMTETPLVVVDTQRGGPSTGMPTKQEQSDIFALILGGHGEAPRIVLAPGTADQAFSDAALAFNLADNYHCPVLIASDLGLADWQQSVDPFELDEVEINRGPIADPKELERLGRDMFERYADSPTGVSPRSLPGMPNGQFLATGAEHGRTGKVTEKADNRVRMMDRRMGKIRHLELNGKPVPGVEYQGPENPEVLLISYGSPIGAVLEAGKILDEKDIRAGVAQVRVLNPLPSEDLRRLIEGAGHAFVIENNATGQLAFLMRANGVTAPVRSVLKYDGTLFRADEVAERVNDLLIREEVQIA
ncbi:MAG: 2-oxoacid:acceptor oxidoreductase subunit alpha [Dehalococcoidia bacterium]